MIIRISLLLTVTSVFLLIAADLSTRLDFPTSAEALAQLGSTIMLSAFALFIAKGLLASGKAVMLAVADYFSSGKRARRRWFFVQAKEDRLNRLFYFRALQLQYFRRQKIQKLLNRNNRKQLWALSRAIQNDLRLHQKKLSKARFKQLQHENITCRDRNDLDALLKLQQKIANLV